MKYQCKNPILLITFIRLDTMKKVFEEIKKVRPSKLYISSNGPREINPYEKKEVQRVREYLLNEINNEISWDCEVKTKFREKYLGCQLSISSTIDWFFEEEEQGIILEDDILPSMDFFKYCDELLERYKNNPRVMHIAGMTYVEKPINEQNYSYHFARVGGIWGWASWRRAWQHYELNMDSYPQALKENIFDDLFKGEDSIKEYYLNMFKNAYKNTYTWDYQWTYTKIINNSINIMPKKNLVKNIGFNVQGSTHTLNNNSKYENMTIHNLDFPLKHPKFIAIDSAFDKLNFNFHFGHKLTEKEHLVFKKNIEHTEKFLTKNHLQTFIYGAGEYGQLFYRSSKIIEQCTFGFIDKYKSKTHEYISGKKVFSIEQVDSNSKMMIILTVVKDNESIEKELQSLLPNSLIININKILTKDTFIEYEKTTL